MRQINAIILDWAGTAVDYGSFAPVSAFMSAFEAFGLSPTVEETRAPMGMQKRAHIEHMLAGERLAGMWKEKHGNPHTQKDIDEIYEKFEPSLLAALPGHIDPLPGVVETVAEIRDMCIVIGSTTGYTRKMMDIVAPLAKEKGYAPDCLVCPDEVGGIGRPYPYMLWRNLEKLKISSIDNVLKIGDTAADMLEAKNAGCIAVGVIRGSNMLGFSEAELAAKNEEEMCGLFESTKQKYIQAGADYVIDDIASLPGLILSVFPAVPCLL